MHIRLRIVLPSTIGINGVILDCGAPAQQGPDHPGLEAPPPRTCDRQDGSGEERNLLSYIRRGYACLLYRYRG